MTRGSLLGRLRPVAPSMLLVLGFLCLALAAFLLGVFLSGVLLGFVIGLAVFGVLCIVMEWLLTDDDRRRQ